MLKNRPVDAAALTPEQRRIELAARAQASLVRWGY